MDREKENGKSPSWWDVLERVVRIAAVTAIPLLLWSISLELRVQNLQSTAATKDWVLKELSDFPSELWREKVGRIEDIAATNTALLHALDKRTVRIETAVDRILREN